MPDLLLFFIIVLSMIFGIPSLIHGDWSIKSKWIFTVMVLSLMMWFTIFQLTRPTETVYVGESTLIEQNNISMDIVLDKDKIINLNEHIKQRIKPGTKIYKKVFSKWHYGIYSLFETKINYQTSEGVEK